MNRASAIVLSAVTCLPGAAVLASSSDVDLPALSASRIAVAEGTVKSVDAKGMSFVLTTGGKDITVTVIKDTKYKVDGKDAKMEDALKPGAKVKVTHADAKASLVEVMREKRR